MHASPCSGSPLPDWQAPGWQPARWFAVPVMILGAGCQAPPGPGVADPPGPGDPGASVGVAASSELAPGNPAVATQVVVSMDEVRVTFPPVADHDWSLAGEEPCVDRVAGRGYDWRILVPEALTAPRSLLVRSSIRCEDRGLSSLEDVIEAASAGVAPPGMLLQFEPTPVEAFVQDGSVVLILRDSVAIIDLFGVRPETVSARGRSAPSEGSEWTETVAVDYVAPFLPPLDSAFLAEARATRLAWEQGVRRTSREIVAVDSRGERLDNPLWMPVGDSIHLEVQEIRCTHDSCRRTEVEIPDSAWSVVDPAVAILGIMEPRPDLRAYAVREVWSMSPAFLRGEAPGRTRVQVAGIPPQDDEDPLWLGAPTALETEIVVTERPVRLELVPRISEAALGDRVEFRTHVTDARGDPIVGATVRISRRSGHTDFRFNHQGGISEITFDRPGLWTLVATLGPLADTVQVRVGSEGS